MFSLIALYFSYRRDVVAAERYIAGLAEKPAASAAVAAPVAAVVVAPVAHELPLAA